MPGKRPGESCTEFQLHKSQTSLLNLKKVFDYTEYRLERYIDLMSDVQQKMTLESILKEYVLGLVAVAWKAGRPVWIRVTKESRHS